MVIYFLVYGWLLDAAAGRLLEDGYWFIVTAVLCEISVPFSNMMPDISPKSVSILLFSRFLGVLTFGMYELVWDASVACLKSDLFEKWNHLENKS